MVLDARGVQQTGLEGACQHGLHFLRLRLLEQPRQRRQVALEGGFGKVHQLPAPIAPVKTAVGGRGRVAVDLAQQVPAGGQDLGAQVE